MIAQICTECLEYFERVVCTLRVLKVSRSKGDAQSFQYPVWQESYFLVVVHHGKN